MADALKVQKRRPAMKKNSSRSVEMKATVERKGRMNNAPGGTVSHRPDYQAVGSKTMAVFQTAQVHDHRLTRTAGDRSLSFTPQLAERSSPSRVRCAAQNQRALDCSGPFYRLTAMKEREPLINASNSLAPPVGRPGPFCVEEFSRGTIPILNGVD